MVLSKLHSKKYTCKDQLTFINPHHQHIKERMYASYANSTYTMNLDKKTTVASKIEPINKYDKINTESQIDTKIYMETPRGEKLQATTSKQSTMKMKIQEVGAKKVGQALNSLRHSLIDGFGRSKPHPSNLLSPSLNPKGEEQAPEQRVSSGSPLWLVWALCGRPPKVAYCQKKVTRHLTKYLCNILRNIVDQMSLKLMVSLGAATSHNISFSDVFLSGSCRCERSCLTVYRFMQTTSEAYSSMEKMITTCTHGFYL